MVTLDNVSAIDTASANTTVVWALRSRVAILGPAVWPAVEAEEGVLLLEAKPDFVLGIGFHQSCGLMAVVVFVWRSIRIPGLAHDQDVGFQADGINVHCDGSNVDIGIVAGGLTGGRAVEVPFGKLVDAFGSFGKRLGTREMN